MANKTVTVLEADGVTETDIVSLDVGRQAAAASKSLALSTEDKTVLDSLDTKLTTITGHVDGLETLITSTNTKLDTVNTTISGGTLTSGSAGAASLQVMTVQGITSMTPILTTATLAAGSAAIGKLAANSGVDIGDVDVTSLPALPAGTNTIGNVIPAGVEYETVAASQTAQALGATGATGDLINGILVIPATTSPGNVLLLDNATSITVFAGGASSVSNLVPFFIPLGIKSVSGAWKITTGTNVSCIGVGDFT